MNKTEYVAALRELADYVESKSFLDKWAGWWSENSFPIPHLEFDTNNKGDFGKLAKAMGTFDKEVTDYSTKAIAKLPLGTTVTVSASRDVVCKRIVTGTTIVPAKEERYEKIEAEPEREIETYKWECPESFIGLAEEEPANV